ncbi:hypothetical protein E4U10_004660 [Claviceps purpurea]|nr:hypothetical protein E4U10_004660 [Claviceps purpurea]KAG6223360.1 hypothetical protein E4U26_004583 [Claviceps purpurea]
MKVGTAALLLCAAIGVNGLSANRRRYLRGRDITVDAAVEASLPPSTSAPTPTPASVAASASSSTTPFSATKIPCINVYPSTLRTTTTRSDGYPAQDNPSRLCAPSSLSSTTAFYGRARGMHIAWDPRPSSLSSLNSSLDGTKSSTTLGSSSTSTSSVSTLNDRVKPTAPYPMTISNATIFTGTGPGGTICPTDGRSCLAIRTTTQTITALPSTTLFAPCTPLPDDGQPVIVYSIVYTSTVTLMGNSSHYLPRYPTIVTPHWCSLSYSYDSPLPTGTDTDDLGMPIDIATFPHSSDMQGFLEPTKRPTVTFVTTDKNPLVMFPTLRRQSYGRSDAFPDPIVHKTAPPIQTAPSETEPGPGPGPGPGSGSGSGSGSGPETESEPGPVPWPGTTPVTDVQPQPTFHITVNGDQVIIDTQTFSPKSGVVEVVTVDGGIFTIGPTVVAGEGGAITKPPPAPTAFTASTPTSGVVGGLSVYVSGTEIAIDGRVMAIPLYSTTTMIDGQNVVVSPNRITVGTNVFTFNLTQPPPEPVVVVDGGQILTAIGKSVVVLHQTTLTYGPGIAPVTEVIQDDTITIGPLGVFVHSMMIGGPNAGINDTRLEIVGGATITRIAPSILIINGRVFTLGPDFQLITTEIAGEAFTIGPMGVTVGKLTMTLPFRGGGGVVGTIVPTSTRRSHFPVETNPHKDKDSSSSISRWDMSRSGIVVCIAIGVLIFG